MREWAWAWGISGMMSKSSQVNSLSKKITAQQGVQLSSRHKVSVHMLISLLLHTDPYHQDPPSSTPPPSAASPAAAAAAAAVVPPKKAGIIHLTASTAVAVAPAAAEAAAATVVATARQERAHLHAPVAYGTPYSPLTLRLPAAAAAAVTATAMGLMPAQQRQKT